MVADARKDDVRGAPCRATASASPRPACPAGGTLRRNTAWAQRFAGGTSRRPPSGPALDALRRRLVRAHPAGSFGAVGVDALPVGHAPALRRQLPGASAATIDGATFKLSKAGSTRNVGAALTYDATSHKAVLDPNNRLEAGTRYRALVTTGAEDLAGDALDQNPTRAGDQQKTWTFTTKG